jgi:hypothetical protein
MTSYDSLVIVMPERPVCIVVPSNYSERFPSRCRREIVNHVIEDVRALPEGGRS